MQFRRILCTTSGFIWPQRVNKRGVVTYRLDLDSYPPGVKALATHIEYINNPLYPGLILTRHSRQVLLRGEGAQLFPLLQGDLVYCPCHDIIGKVLSSGIPLHISSAISLLFFFSFPSLVAFHTFADVNNSSSTISRVIDVSSTISSIRRYSVNLEHMKNRCTAFSLLHCRTGALGILVLVFVEKQPSPGNICVNE